MAGGSYTAEIEELYDLDNDRDLIITYAGLLNRVHEALREDGFHVTAVDAAPIPSFEPVYDRLKGESFRGGQLKMMSSMIAHERGQYNAFTAAGKSHMIRAFVQLYPYDDCRIMIAAPSTAIVEEFYEKMKEVIPEDELGLFYSRAKQPGRIVITTSRSMLAPGPDWVKRCNILLYDEVHTAGSPAMEQTLAHFHSARMYGFSASTEVRTDGADRVVEAFFGPVRETITMEEGWDEGYAAEVECYFYRVPAFRSQYQQTVSRKRHEIWRNRARNRAIERIVRHWEARFEAEHGRDPQILIMSDTLEHVLIVASMLPEYQIFYGSGSEKTIDKFREQGKLPTQFRPLKPKDRTTMRQDMTDGRMRRIIGTTSLGTGVDFRHLDVFIRIDCGSSEVSNIQYRGRSNRGEKGVYIDIFDFGDGEDNRRGTRESAARKRFASAQREGWDPQLVEVP